MDKFLFYSIWQLMNRIPFLQNIRLLFYFFDSIFLLFHKKNIHENGKKKVLVLFSHAVGDVIMFRSISDHFRKIYPKGEFELSIMCLKSCEDLFKDDFDITIPVDFPKTSIDLKYRYETFKLVRREYYDILIDPIGMEECSPNVFFANAICAKKKIGLLHKQQKKYQCPNWLMKKIYTETLYIDEENLHKNLSYAAFLSMMTNERVTPRIAELIPVKQHIINKEYIIVFPSASIPSKRWSVNGFAEITRRIVKTKGYAVVCCGTEADREIVGKYIDLLGSDIEVTNMLAKTSITGLIDLIGNAELVLTNDTSVFHIAVATRRKTCVVSGDYVYDTFLNYKDEKYSNFDSDLLEIVTGGCDKVNCNNDCKYRYDNCYPCVERVTVDQVWRSVELLLDRSEK